MKASALYILVLILIIYGCGPDESHLRDTVEEGNIPITSILSRMNDEGYARALQPVRFQFPQDYGPHPEFRSEWWYLTGNLTNQQGRRFGFQFTIFRTAVSPDSPRGTSEWRTRQFYMGHFAITDVDGGRFYPAERFSRGAIGLAGAQAEPFRVWLENWSIEQIADTLFVLRLRARSGGESIDLSVQAVKPIVLQGDKGYSQKGREPGNASYYYSFTRMAATGSLSVSNQTHEVSGTAWFDREWSTSALSPEQTGWDWLSLQLDNGVDIMWYQIRRKDGSVSPFSSGAIILDIGESISVAPEQIDLSILDTWNSLSGRRYPGKWQLTIPEHQIALTITPQIPNQEWTGRFRYWEGAVVCKGTMNGRSVPGNGYVELTGY